MEWQNDKNSFKKEALWLVVLITQKYMYSHVKLKLQQDITTSCCEINFHSSNKYVKVARPWFCPSFDNEPDRTSLLIEAHPQCIDNHHLDNKTTTINMSMMRAKIIYNHSTINNL